MNEGKANSKLHPVQMRNLIVRELTLKIYNIVDAVKYQSGDFTLSSGYSEYIKEDKRITVMMKCEIGSDKKNEVDIPFYLNVEISADFQINNNSFNEEFIYDWADKAAPYILLPYLREHVYSLSIKASIPPILLPLFEVPTITFSKSK